MIPNFLRNFGRPLLVGLVAICTLLSAHHFIQAQDDATIKVESSAVMMNATISDGSGNAVTGLRRELFSVFEDGKKQEISYFSSGETPFAAVILIDTSGSMESRISLARSAAINFLDGLRRNDVAAIYRFASKSVLVQDFSGSRDVVESIFDLKADGMTSLNDAIFKAAEDLAGRPEKRRAIIVLSDGADTFSGKSTNKALKAALDANALIYTVDMSAIDTDGKQRLQNQGALKTFASKSGGKFVAAQGGPALREAFSSIVSELGQQYTIGYDPQNLAKDGKWHEIEVRVARPDLVIRTRKGYNAPK